ncbi:MAG: hypothetical protein INF52_11515 [Rhodobacter sp.]|nr:hypothetical protein [Rhodobacter sp.]
MGALEMEPKIAAALRQSFPLADDGELSAWAGEIYERWIAAAALDVLERTDRPPAKDADSLARAVAQLLRAAEALNEVGYHGAKELSGLAGDFPGLDTGGTTVLLGADAGKVIGRHLKKLADDLKAAARRIPKDAQSFNSALDSDDDPGLDRHTGRPRNAAARAVSDDCARAYEHFNGRQEVPTNPKHNSAYGPFLDLIDRVFSSLEINASSEFWAREATRKRGKVRK